MSTRSYVSLRRRALRSAASTSARRTCARRGSIPSAAMFSRSVRSCVELALDEHDPLGPARQRLDAERAGAGEQVEHPRPLQLAEHREQRLAHALRRRPRGPAPRRLEPPAPETPGDHAHAITVTAAGR